MLARALTLVGALLCVTACQTEIVTLPATQITVRVLPSAEVRVKSSALRIGVASREGSEWSPARARELVAIALAGPVDVPIIPGEDAPRDQRIEVVVEALDDTRHVLAQARVITSFVPHEQRLLEVPLSRCGELPLGELCEADASCHGETCRTCVDGMCASTPVTSGADLPPLDPDGEAVLPESDSVLTGPSDEGDGGAPDAPSCEAETRCNDGAVERCRDGTWTVVERCPFSCAQGACTGQCKPGVDTRCNGLVVEECSAEARWVPKTVCIDACVDAACKTRPSCEATLMCGSNESCCLSLAVPGGTFHRSYDGRDHTNMSFPATVSPFELDRYEVTVGRFRKWLDVYDRPGARPAAGAGKNPNDALDVGWSADWDELLAEDSTALLARLASCDDQGVPSFSDAAEAERLPVNCVDWYTALAFCIWDEGRLPTEAEWNFAAAGGDAQRVFPWSDPPSDATIDARHAVYGDAPLAPVGTKRKYDEARWGHLDLGGNVAEWVYDWLRKPYSDGDCRDCGFGPVSESKVRRGGGVRLPVLTAQASYRAGSAPEWRASYTGFRCAR